MPGPRGEGLTVSSGGELLAFAWLEDNRETVGGVRHLGCSCVSVSLYTSIMHMLQMRCK